MQLTRIAGFVLASGMVLTAGTGVASADDSQPQPTCYIYINGNNNNAACGNLVVTQSGASQSTVTRYLYNIHNGTADLTLVHLADTGSVLPLAPGHRIQPGGSLTRVADATPAATDAAVEYNVVDAQGIVLGTVKLTMENGRIGCQSSTPGVACGTDGNFTATIVRI